MGVNQIKHASEAHTGVVHFDPSMFSVYHLQQEMVWLIFRFWLIICIF